jgi:hypothetical protein
MALACGLLALGPRAGAVIFFATEDPAHNTTEPVGALAGSGWQYQGQWLGFLGTPIAPDLFISTTHIGGQPGDLFHFDGRTYPALEAYHDEVTDLVIFKVCGTFPRFAPLYETSDEAGKLMVLIGRGAPRGAPVVLTNGTQQVLKGWLWGGGDGIQRWGVNRVTGAIDLGPGLGGVLKAAFDADGEAEEACLAGGDSAGAVFIQRGAAWQLAGINLAVDGPYNYTNSGPGFFAALFDEGGLFTGDEGDWQKVVDTVANRPMGFYATRISERLAWIQDIIALHGGGQTLPVVQTASKVNGPFTPDPDAIVDPDARTVTVAPAAKNGFFRLTSCSALRITTITIRGGQVVLGYE